uniref:Uncharacterized protein n=1 Tax=Soybean thrips tombus-like virus 3 TaxID=2802945 RepID=A0A7T8G274_9TOMB|nr:hypothetical protein 3 [Soybean thrips tombus-like virus 3]
MRATLGVRIDLTKNYDLEFVINTNYYFSFLFTIQPVDGDKYHINGLSLYEPLEPFHVVGAIGFDSFRYSQQPIGVKEDQYPNVKDPKYHKLCQSASIQASGLFKYTGDDPFIILSIPLTNQDDEWGAITRPNIYFTFVFTNFVVGKFKPLSVETIMADQMVIS